MASLFSVFKRSDSAQGAEVSAVETVQRSAEGVTTTIVTETTGSETPSLRYTLTDGHYQLSPTAAEVRVTDVRTLSPTRVRTLSPTGVRTLSPARVVRAGVPAAVYEEVRSPAYSSTPLSAQVYRAGPVAPFVEDRVVLRDASPVRLVNPIRLAAPPVFGSLAPAVRVSSPVRRLPPSYSTPVVSSRVAEYPTTRTYDAGYTSYSPSVPLLRNGKAFQKSSDLVVATASATAAAAGFMRIGDEYFPTDNYHASSGRYYSEGRSAVPVETVQSYKTRTAVAESYPSYSSVPVTVADYDGRYAASARCLPQISSRDQYDRYVELRDPVKMRHPSRDSYTQFRETLPPKPVISS